MAAAASSETNFSEKVDLLSNEDPTVRADAALALWKFSSEDVKNKELIRTAGGVELLCTLLTDPNERVIEQAAGALGSLSTDPEIQKLIQTADGIVHLCALLIRNNPQLKKNAARVLMNLSTSSNYIHDIQTAGGIIPLCTLLKALDSNEEEVINNAALILYHLLCYDPECIKMILQADGITPLFSLLINGNPVVAENAATLLFFSVLNPDVQEKILMAGGIEYLRLLLSNPSSPSSVKTLGAYVVCSLKDLPDEMTILTQMATAFLANKTQETPRARENGGGSDAAATPFFAP